MGNGQMALGFKEKGEDGKKGKEQFHWKSWRMKDWGDVLSSVKLDE